MISSIRLVPSADSSTYAENCALTFDLIVEGLNQKQARTLSQAGHDLMLGTPVPETPVGSEFQINPLAQLTEQAQKSLAILAILHFNRFGNRIMTIKMIRILYSSGLKDAKDFVDFALGCTIFGTEDLGYSGKLVTRPLWIKF